MPYEKSKQEQEEGWDLAAYGAAYEADRPTSSFPQCSLTVCTVYLQVEIYSHNRLTCIKDGGRRESSVEIPLPHWNAL